MAFAAFLFFGGAFCALDFGGLVWLGDVLAGHLDSVADMRGEIDTGRRSDQFVGAAACDVGQHVGVGLGALLQATADGYRATATFLALLLALCRDGRPAAKE